MTWDTYDSRVYDKARELLDCQIEEGVYVTDPEENYYLYELTMEGRRPDRYRGLLFH